MLSEKDTENMRSILNQTYKPIVDKSNELKDTLSEQYSDDELTIGFYNNHYHKTPGGEYRADAYPIPVISITGLCDIEIDFDTLCVTSKLSKAQAVAFDWKTLGDISFEVYGCDDYLADYGSNKTMDAICAKITPSDEREFFISVYYPEPTSAADIIEMIAFLKHNKFYY